MTKRQALEMAVERLNYIDDQMEIYNTFVHRYPEYNMPTIRRDTVIEPVAGNPNYKKFYKEAETGR